MWTLNEDPIQLIESAVILGRTFLAGVSSSLTLPSTRRCLALFYALDVLRTAAKDALPFLFFDSCRLSRFRAIGMLILCCVYVRENVNLGWSREFGRNMTNLRSWLILGAVLITYDLKVKFTMTLYMILQAVLRAKALLALAFWADVRLLTCKNKMYSPDQRWWISTKHASLLFTVKTDMVIHFTQDLIHRINQISSAAL